RRDFVQVLQRSEGSSIEQILFDIRKRSLDLSLRLRPMRTASPWLKAIMRGEGEKASVVDRLIAIIAGDHDFHVVVETGGSQAAEILEGADVFANGGGKVLSLHESQVLAARIPQQVAESVHTAPAFRCKRDLVRRVIHLCLHTRSCLEALHRWFRRMRPQCA